MTDQSESATYRERLLARHRPTFEDLDAAPARAHWCCTGNAEDCPLCADTNPSYPFLCPGHPDTAENRQQAKAAHKATGQAAEGWTHLEARAFNAVQPALSKAGAWLPLSVRRKVANAIIAELKPELDALAEARCERQLTGDMAGTEETRQPKPADSIRDDLLRAIDFNYAVSLGYSTPEALLAAYDAQAGQG
ncbi:hypothetical protein ACWEGQ_00245 [Streptomyces seoulensis]